MAEPGHGEAFRPGEPPRGGRNSGSALDPRRRSTGKTSALLAAYCHLCHRPLPLGAGEAPVVPIFIPLPHDSDALDRRVWDQLGVASRSEAEVVARRAIIILLLDSIDECVMLPERRGRALVRAASFSAQWCRIIASCRADSAHLAHIVVEGKETSAWHVMPFDAADWRDYVDKFSASARSGSCSASALLAAIDEYDPSGELREQPVTLSMMVTLAVSDCAPRLATPPSLSEEPRERFSRRHGATAVLDDATAAPIALGCVSHKVGGCVGRVIESPRAAVYRRFLEAMCDAAAARHVGISSDAPGSASPSLLALLEDAAIAMLARGRWQIGLDEVLAAGGEHATSLLAAAIQSGDLACRVDAMNPSALFGFSHRSIAEYLAARGLWTRPQLLERIPRSFSREELGVVRWFGDISSGDARLRATVCGDVLLGFAAARGRTGRVIVQRHGAGGVQRVPLGRRHDRAPSHRTLQPAARRPVGLRPQRHDLRPVRAQQGGLHLRQR